jgi:uncharacterized protein YegL
MSKKRADSKSKNQGHQESRVAKALQNSPESESHHKLVGHVKLILKWNTKKQKKFELSCTTFNEKSVEKTIYFDYPTYPNGGAIRYLPSGSNQSELIDIELSNLPKTVLFLTFGISNFYDAYFEEAFNFDYSFVDKSDNVLAHDTVHVDPQDSGVFLCFLYRPVVPGSPDEFRLKSTKTVFKKRCRVMLDFLPEIARRLSSESHLITSMSSTPFHTVFVLDASGSMSGAPWDQLVKAVKQFVADRKDASPKDLYSMVIYDSSANIVCESVKISTSPDHFFKYTGGGTSFGAALGTAYKVLERADFENYTPLLLFLSDGESTDGETEMKSVASNFCKKGLQVYTVGFGNGSSHASLKNFAKIGNGKFLLAANGIELGKTFAMISDEMNAKK